MRLKPGLKMLAGTCYFPHMGTGMQVPRHCKPVKREENHADTHHVLHKFDVCHLIDETNAIITMMRRFDVSIHPRMSVHLSSP